MKGKLIKKDQDWFIITTDSDEYSLHPDHTKICDDIDEWNNSDVEFEIVKRFLYNETQYFAKLLPPANKKVITLDDKYKEYEINHPDSTYSFHEWMNIIYIPYTDDIVKQIEEYKATQNK